MKLRIALSIFAALTTASAQTSPNAEANFTLFGGVTDALTRNPVRRAWVKIYNSKEQWDELTDGEGRFKFPPLRRAEYSLVAHRDGYTDRYYKVELSDFDHPAQLPVELFPQGVITGKVTNGLGQPLERAHIEALPTHTREGLPAGGPSTESTDLGEYRLSGLDPGGYRIRVTYLEGREYELDPTPRTTASAFYGGGDKPAELTVKAGAVVGGIDFVLSPVRPVTVRGTVRTQDGQAVDRVSLSIGGATGGSSVNNGKFEIPDVSPGTYLIAAETLDKSSPLFGAASVDVHGEDITGVELVLRPMPKIEGTVRVEGGDRDLAHQVQIFFLPSDRTQMMAMKLARPNEAGAFEAALRPGEYLVTFQSLPPGIAITQATLDGQPMTSWNIKVEPSPEPRKLVLVLGKKKEP